MKTEHLDYLLEVVKCRSINKASKKLHFNHQYLSQIINGVEEECGVKLLKRTHLGIELTEAGQKALPQMEEISRGFHAMLASLQPEPQRTPLSGVYKLYCLVSINPQGIVRTIRALQGQYPGVDLVLQESDCENVIERVRTEREAIGQILFSPQVESLNLKLPENVELIPLIERQVVAWVSGDSALGKKYESITLKSVLKYNVILYAPEGKENSAAYKIMCSVMPKAPVKYVTNNLSTFYQLMAGENSITVGTKQTFSSAMGKLEMIPVRDNIKVLVALLVNKEGRDLPFVRAFTDTCQEQYLLEE